jgi:hypothetical protein
VHEVAAYWEQHLDEDEGEGGRSSQWLAQRLTQTAFSSPANARVLLRAALRYAHHLSESDPENDDYIADWVGVTQAVGLALASGDDFAGAAKVLMIAAARVTERRSANPRLVAAAEGLATSLRWIAQKPGVDRDVAANCIFRAEHL